MALDYITGIIVAIIHKNLSSEIGFKGMAKKLLILVFYAIGHMIDTFVFADMAIVTSAVTFFYLANEGVSIVENAVKLGLPVPQKIRDVLAQLKSKSEDQSQIATERSYTMDLEELMNDLEYISNSENPMEQRVERCSAVRNQVEGLHKTLESCGSFDENGQFVKDTTEVDALKQQVVDITEKAEETSKKYQELETKYRERFFGGKTETEEHVSHDEYVSAIDKLFN